jgi:hypothetical protein
MRIRMLSTALASTTLLLFASTGLAQSCCEGETEKCESCQAAEALNVTAVALAGPASEKADALFQDGDLAAACEVYAQFIEDGHATGKDWFQYGYALHMTGKIEEAKKAHAEAAGFANYRPIALYNLGCAFALEGDKDGAFKALGQSAKVGFAAYETVVEDSDLESLHGDDRWSDYTYSIKKNAKVAQARRQLDFWIGNWSVALEDGTEIGINRISAGVRGNCIVEDWSSDRYGVSKSMSIYDANKNTWRQTHVTASGEVVDWKGHFEDGVMTFSSNIAEEGKFKNTLAPADDGRLVQTMYRMSDDGEWTTAWTVFYTPIESKDHDYKGKEEMGEKDAKRISASH